MTVRKIVLLACALGIVLNACNSYAQGGGSTPPPCCTKEDPPPSGGDSVPLTIPATDSMPVLTVSDAALKDMGLTRAQFLNQIADAVFPDSSSGILLVFPVWTPVQNANGTIGYEISYYALQKSEATAEFLNAATTLYMTDGTTVIGIDFVPGPVS